MTNYKIILRYTKVSKNTMVPFIDIKLNNETIATVEVSTYKSISAKNIPVNSSLNNVIKSKSQLIDALGDYSFRGSFFPVKKYYTHEDLKMYELYINALEYINNPDYSYDAEYFKDNLLKFKNAYPEFVYCDIKKRHVMKKNRKQFFKIKYLQVGTDEEINKGIDFYKNLK